MMEKAIIKPKKAQSWFNHKARKNVVIINLIQNLKNLMQALPNCSYFSTTERNCKKPLLFSLAKEGERTFCLHLSKLDIHIGVKFIFWGAFVYFSHQTFWREFCARFITAAIDHKPNDNYCFKVSSLFKLQLLKKVTTKLVNPHLIFGHRTGLCPSVPFDLVNFKKTKNEGTPILKLAMVKWL